MTLGAGAFGQVAYYGVLGLLPPYVSTAPTARRGAEIVGTGARRSAGELPSAWKMEIIRQKPSKGRKCSPG